MTPPPTGTSPQAPSASHPSSAVKEAISTAKAKPVKPVPGKRSLAGRQVAVTNPQPHPEPVDGATLLKDIAQVFSRYVVLPPRMAEVVALFTLYTYVFPDTFVSPLLAIQSPVMRCGNCTVMLLGWSPGPTEFSVFAICVIVIVLHMRDGDR